MKYIIYISAFVLILFGCKTEFRKVIDKYPNGKTKAEFVYLDKNDTSKYSIIEYFMTGKVSFKGFVENGKFVIAKINYYDNGNFKEIDSIINPCDLNDCCCDGKVIKYFSNGKLNQSFEKRNGLTNGLIILYYSDSSGIIDLIGTLENGKKSGIQKGFYKSGKLHSLAMYKNDTLIGRSQYFKENGDTTDKY